MTSREKETAFLLDIDGISSSADNDHTKAERLMTSYTQLATNGIWDFALITLSSKEHSLIKQLLSIQNTDGSL